MQRKHIVFLSIGAIALLAATAGASAYITQSLNDAPKTEKVASAAKANKVGENIRWNDAPAQPQRMASACNDGNIVGTVLGGVGGGVAGSQFGKGDGKTAATIGGAVAGGYLGNQFIPTHNITCR